jgi:hypothetical protein
VYHVELRDFPQNMSRFNLGERELRAIVEPWARGQVIEFGEHKWNPQQAEITILEGPQLPLHELKMGRGWRAAERQGTDVTDAVITAAREAFFAGGGGAQAQTHAAGAAGSEPRDVGGAPAAGGPAGGDPLALAMQLGALLGPDAMRLLDAWRVAAAGSPGLAPSEALAQAERAVRAAGATDG